MGQNDDLGRNDDARRNDDAPEGDASDDRPVERRGPVVPDNSFSRESYAIHATRSELPLFSDALTDGRDDSGWLSALSGVLGGGGRDATTAAAEAAIERRRREKP